MPTEIFIAAAGAVSGAVGGELAKPGYDQALRAFLEVLIFLANAAGGIVVGVAVLRGLITYVRDLFVLRGAEVPKESIRLSLGRSLALALEFQVGADILGTALDPSIRDLTTLAAIVVLRTVLNFFLGRELSEAERRARPSRESDEVLTPRS